MAKPRCLAGHDRTYYFPVAFRSNTGESNRVGEFASPCPFCDEYRFWKMVASAREEYGERGVQDAIISVMLSLTETARA